MPSSPLPQTRRQQLLGVVEGFARTSSAKNKPQGILFVGPPTHSIRRFVDDTITTLQDQGVLCLEATAEEGTPQSMGALAQIVEQGLRHLEQEGETTPVIGVLASFGWTPENRRIMPQLDHLLGRDARANLLEAIRRLLLLVGRNQKTAIILRRLDQADEDTLSALRDLLDHGAPSATSRDLGKELDVLPTILMELPLSNEKAQEIRGQFEEFERVVIHPIDGLDRTAIESWLTSDPVVERVHALTQGDPARMDALLEALPTDLEALFARRFSALPPEGQKVAKILALSRIPMDGARLRELLDLTQLELSRGLESLRTNGLLFDHPDNRITLRDGRTWLVGQMPEKDRLDAHNALGASLAASWTRSQDEGLLEHAAYHFMAAGDRERTIAFCLQAGAELQQRMCLHAARTLYHTLLDFAPPRSTALVAWSRLAEVCTAMDRIEEASEALEEVLALSREEADASTLVHLGELQLACGHIGQATESLAKALEDCPINDTQLIQKARLALSQVLLVDGKLDEAWNLATEDSIRDVPEAELIQGNIRFRQGRHEDAAKAYLRAARGSDPMVQLRAHHNHGLIAMRNGRHADAVRHLHESLQIAESRGSYFGVAISQVNLGVTYEHMERFALAEQFLTQAAALFERLGRRTNLVSALSSLADLRLRMGEPRNARRLLLRAMKIAQDEGCEYETEWARMKMGQVEIARERWGQAKNCLERASVYFQEYGHTEDLAWSLLHLTEVYTTRDRLSEAQILLSTLEDMSLRPEHEVNALALLAEAHLNAKRGRWHETASLTQETLPLLEALGQREPQIECLTLLAQALKAIHDQTGAEKALHRATVILDGLKKEVPLASRNRYLRRTAFRGLKPLEAGVQSGESPMEALADEQDGSSPTQAGVDRRMNWNEISLDEAKRQLEIDLISKALEETEGNITKAAALLKVKRPRLSQKIKEYGIRITRSPNERTS